MTAEKINELVKLIKKEDIIPEAVKGEYDPFDYSLPEPIFIGKRLSEYFSFQKVYITDSNMFTGMLRFDLGDEADVPGDVFPRTNHKSFAKACKHFYCKPIDNLTIFEWQHSSPNYEYILKNGICGTLGKIKHYKEVYRFDKDKYEFLCGMEYVCLGVISHAKKCSEAYRLAAEAEKEPKRKAMLSEIAENCENVPENPAKTFFEGLQSVLFCFYCLSDSIGTLDRYMLDLYKNDIENGRITREEAKLYLKEFFVHLSAYTPYTSVNADRSAECHFAIGGYTERGEDGFNDLSKLIVEALMELDTRRPSISFRWTEKTPFETLKYILDCERNDKNKRIAIVNDEPRIKGLMRHVGLSFSDAVKYTMVGCNEPAFPGAIWLGGETVNIVRCLTNTLYTRTDDIVNAKCFDDFCSVFKEELQKDINEIFDHAEKYNAMREKDCSMLSSFLIDGCIENAKPVTRYGCKIPIGGFNIMGLTCVIDSLTVIKQFVFEEKKLTMSHFIDVMKSNWKSDPDLRSEILKTGRFFGNNDPLSDEMARFFTTELCNVTSERRLPNGARAIIGTLTGYNPHYATFGALTPATPDGRYDGEAFMVGSGQVNGKDRNGLLALMKSLAGMDPENIMVGPVVCNMMIDEALIRKDEYFENVCRMLETYFKLGGIHVQLNYVSKEELLSARKTPENYGNLKVRVSGFSATFVDLNEKIQDEIITRTVKEG